jgi:beta-N-acetylglucosaminidase
MPQVKIPFNVPGAKAPSTPQVKTPVTQIETSATEEAPQAETSTSTTEKSKRTVNRQATRMIKPEDIEFVMKNVRTMSYSEMAEKLGLTRHQVNRILMDIKKGLREEAKKTGKVKEVEKFIKEHLSRPEDSRPGGQKGGGAVKNAIDATVSNILKNLG